LFVKKPYDVIHVPFGSFSSLPLVFVADDVEAELDFFLPNNRENIRLLFCLFLFVLFFVCCGENSVWSSN